jgi:hypothetical protein
MGRVTKSLLILILAVLHICACASKADAQTQRSPTPMTKEEASVLALTEAAWRVSLSTLLRRYKSKPVSFNLQRQR